jgi:hypothetical protein
MEAENKDNLVNTILLLKGISNGISSQTVLYKTLENEKKFINIYKN